MSMTDQGKHCAQQQRNPAVPVIFMAGFVKICPEFFFIILRIHTRETVEMKSTQLSCMCVE
jgi:hypothetical protein